MAPSPRTALFVLVLLGLPLGARAADGDKDARPGVPDAELQEKINEAIRRGAGWLRKQQKPNGSMGGLFRRGSQSFEIGASGLAGLALLAAGDQRGDPEVDKLYEYLKAKDAQLRPSGSGTTYDESVLLMFICRYWRGEEKEFTGSTRPGRRHDNPCKMPPDVLKWVQDIANWLVRMRKPATATWGYPAHRDDHSNTQYAYLGLRDARDCGAMIPPQVFLQGVQTMIERQEPDGPKVPRIIPGPDGSRYAIQSGDRARGWSYLQQPFVPTGSMTTSGIGIVAICNDALLRPRRIPAYDTTLERKAQQAVQDGFCWLDKNWTVERNPGPAAANWHHYYLYGLERAAVLGGRDLVGLHDWYVEGARHLVGTQKGDGSWRTGALGEADPQNGYEASDLCDTAWAVLFLARATRPAPPIRAPVVTGGD
jgi:hypothetical protein